MAGEFLYTVVCRHYTVNGIIELDLYEVLRRLRIDPKWSEYNVIRYHVYTGQAVEYVIKKVLRKIELNEDTKRFYSHHPGWSIWYDCRYDMKDVANMNHDSIVMRLQMTDEEFNKIYGRRILC